VSAFERKLAAARGPGAQAAPKVVALEPHHFVSAWHLRPAERVLFGLRVPCEQEFEGALIEARRVVSAITVADEDRDEAFERAYLRVVVARAVCDPNNVNAPHPTVPLPDDQVAVAFPPATIRWLFDELDRLHIEQSPSYSAATDEEVARLCAVLALDGAIDELEPLPAARVRRYVSFILAELES
jgi:hypothetical protein